MLLVRCGRITYTRGVQSIRCSRRLPGSWSAVSTSTDVLLRRTGSSLGFDVAHLGTHVGRRSLITALYTNGAQFDDIQHHIGHSDSRTAAGYVASIGKRPQRTASIAAQSMNRPAVEQKPSTEPRPPAA